MKTMLFLEKRYLGCSAQEMGISLKKKTTGLAKPIQ
jgi:hypothetical protein